MELLEYLSDPHAVHFGSFPAPFFIAGIVIFLGYQSSLILRDAL